MKITKIETISLAEFPNVIWIQVHTDAGHVGLGETFFGSQAIHAYVHETLAPQMLARTTANAKNGITRNQSVTRKSNAAGHPSR